ncbi:MAG: UDP-N-acetylmuramate dehydrogenase [bacterium]
MPSPPPVFVRRDVPLAPLTTLEVGGPARYFVDGHDPAELAAALAWARAADVEVLVFGGGSNLLVADAGFDGLALRVATTGITVEAAGEAITLRVAAGEPWDALVTRAVGERWAGIECLAGIPGAVGAAPIQNIGAYGQEVADVLVAVEALDRVSGEVARFAAAECGFGYRQSRFKGDPTRRHVVTAVTLALRPGGAPTVRYAELAAAVDATRGLAAVSDAVRALRRSKSMVLDPSDPNRRSAGSFFLNPVLPGAAVAAVTARVAAAGHDPSTMPAWPQPDGAVKLSAAWLIERAGLTRGFGDGRVGLSSRHTLAVVNRGGATAAEIVAFAGQVRATVRARFGVALHPEPVFAGFDRAVEALLDG